MQEDTIDDFEYFETMFGVNDPDEIIDNLIMDDESGIEESEERAIVNESKKFYDAEKESFFKMDVEFGRFLENFVNNQNTKEKQKKWFKIIFFTVIMLLMIFIVISPFVMVLVFRKQMTDVTLLGAIIASLVELVSAILVLPKIIAEYLFNKAEDANMMKIIESMQTYNEKKHTYLTEHKNNEEDV